MITVGPSRRPAPAPDLGRTHVTWMIDSLGRGGAERLIPPLLTRLRTRGMVPRVCVLQERNGNPVAKDLVQAGIPVDQVPVRHLRDASNGPRLLRYLGRNRPDILHTQLEFSATLGSMAARMLGIPSVSTLHVLQNAPRRSRESWRHRFMWWSLRLFCDQIIAVSDGTREHHIRSGSLNPSKIITQYNGIDLSLFERPDDRTLNAKRQTLGIPPQAPLLITVAFLREPKGIQHMIRSLPAILTVRPNTRYLIAGEGDHEARLRELTGRHGLTDHVIFAGLAEDVPELLAMSDVFVLPTLDDALPTVLAEAMAARLPIVASRVGGVPEMVRHGVNGLLVPPADPAALARACLDLVNEAGMAGRMGAAGREIARRCFDIDDQIQRLCELYAALVKRQACD